ncbi:MAG TPA: hypothetical protein VFN35_24485 [Ktedonobacteraceae bacterium]|nr:hypothetical protein [Ktedonobacteraceae bacterium]
MTEKANHLDQELQRRDKAELIALIKLMLQQRPELSWVLQTQKPAMGKQLSSIDTYPYRQQIEAAVSAIIEHHRDRTYREALGNTLETIQTVADGFAQQTDYLSALAIYEVLVVEAISHYFTIETGYLLFTPILEHCIDGLDSCVAEAGDNQDMRQRAFKGLFAIYRFSAGSGLDLGEDIPDLLVGNATSEERQIIAGWVHKELAQLSSNAGSAEKAYHHLLHRLKNEGYFLEDEQA